jgi:hypothetical protein
MTPYGARQQMRARPGAAGLVSAPGLANAARKPRRWEYLLCIVGFAILALIIVSHLLGSGAHGH